MSDADKEWEELLSCLKGDFDEIAAHCKELREALKWYTNPKNRPVARNQFGNTVTYQELDINQTESPAHKLLSKRPSDYEVSND